MQDEEALIFVLSQIRDEVRGIKLQIKWGQVAIILGMSYWAIIFLVLMMRG